MLRHELYSMIQVPRLKDENATELFLGFHIGTVRSCDFAVLPIQGQGGFRRLKRFSASKMPVGAKMVVVFKTCVEHRLLLAFGHAFMFAFVVVSQTDVFHPFLLVSCDAEPQLIVRLSDSRSGNRKSTATPYFVASSEDVGMHLFVRLGKAEATRNRRRTCASSRSMTSVHLLRGFHRHHHRQPEHRETIRWEHHDLR